MVDRLNKKKDGKWNIIKGKFRVIIIELRLRGSRPRGAISELMLHFTVNDVKEGDPPRSWNLPVFITKGLFSMLPLIFRALSFFPLHIC